MIYVIEGFKPMGITHTRLYPSKTHTLGTGMGLSWVWVRVEAQTPTGLPMSFTRCALCQQGIYNDIYKFKPF